MKDEKKVPKLRFKGFTDDWEQCKLGDVAEIVGGGTPSTKKSEYWNGNINWFSPAEIGNQIFVSHSQKQITELGLMKSSAKILPAGTILFTSRAGIGNTAILTRNACTNQGFQSIVPYSNKLDSYFIYSESSKLKRYGETMGSGSTFTEVSGKQMKKMSLHIPTINEQAKIGNMLKILDQTITLHEEKKSQLERLKSALLQKMFADKSGYPAVRFRGFDERWEQYKAKELFESKSKKDHSDLPVLSATQENGIVFRNDLDIDIKFDTHALSNYKVVSPGDYIISLRSFQGGFELSEKLGIISPAYTVFAFNNQEKNRQNSTFWKYLFKRYDFIESLKRLTFGIRDGKAISFNQFSTLKLSFPNFDEQNKIATLLHELDKTIALHDQKLSLLKHVKQSLLQNIFI
jgi:type I restriction enzyme S subunit